MLRRYVPFLLLSTMLGIYVWLLMDWEYLLPVQPPAEEGMQLPAVAPMQLPAVAPMTGESYSMDNIVMIPLEAYNTCGDRILHMSCLRTIVATESALPVAPNLYPQLCDDIMASVKLEGSKWQVEDAHCMLCLQVNGIVGALVEMSSDTEKIRRYLLPSESQGIAHALSHAIVQRVVDRKTIVLRQWYPPYSSKNNGDREWRERRSNCGNFLWQYGATRMINPFTTLFLDQSSDAASTASAFVIAEANALNLDKPDWSRGLFSHLLSLQRRLNVPTIILGIGLQSEFGSDSSSYKLLDFQKDYFVDLEKRQKHPAIGVRGNLTRIACENSGITHCITTGCPSLTINVERNLGSLIEQRWKNLVSKLASKERIKMVLVLPKPLKTGNHKTLLPLFLKLAQIYESTVIIQVKNDFNILREWELEKHARNATFSNVEEWFKLTESVDLVLTARIHGGMAGIARGTPTILIPTDLRIQELADTMMIPQLPMEYAKEQGDTVDLLGLVEKVKTHFAGFEKNRRELLSTWSGILKEAELEMNPKLLEVVKDTNSEVHP